MSVLPNKLAQTATFCQKYGYLSLGRHIKVKKITFFESRPKFITAVQVH
jgi:hypothetical protein